MKPKNFQPTDDFWNPAESRYDDVPIVRCGKSGLQLPRIALGTWHNFGDDTPFQTQRDIVRYAFSRGVIHFDIANNYGPPAGSTEENFGRIVAKDLRAHRHELVVSTKAGMAMWPGPTGFGGSRAYLLNSLDESLMRLGMDYVDIFYHHRPDPDVPLEESMLALHDAVRSGKARYAGISSYSAAAAAQAQEIMRELGTPIVIHQPSYSMLNRWVEEGEPSLLETAAAEGMGVIAFSPLAQGLLTNKYLDGVPEGSRLSKGKVSETYFTEENLGHVRALNDIAAERGQSLAQMAIAWILRDQGEATVTTALVGASSVRQLEDTLGALDNTDFSAEELRRIDEHAVESGINTWWHATQSRM
ncbi:L-glyceraldehyde 3-phosphate reductase [Trueperella bonasi]|uniref:L-glyceraldehyde 3-phosphate reductase n=1 Tax=Trueperella bonasi TaxID=312286 RepID=A0ABT9NFL9_9ACTO|nr:aldo/keto reductase [Trueperella bonasi]MDP9806155.1 L-glyceraldehyde 3-phosphate reductase [Trueperella bonasi]